MKKIIAMILALACCLSLFGCKKDAESETEKTTPKKTVATKTPTTASTEAPTKPALQATTELTETSPEKPGETTETAATQASTEAPTEMTETSPEKPDETTGTAASQTATQKPTEAPTSAPTQAPTKATATKVTQAPTKKPVVAPTRTPTQKPTTTPVTAATKAPATKATQAATKAPATKATQAATKAPATKATQAATTAPTQAPTSAPTTAPTVHTHTFGDWILQAASSCIKAGREERRCACGFSESRELPLADHRMNGTICRTCNKVIFDDNAALVELGVVVDSKYGTGSVANKVWDIRVWNGKVYRAAGDYDKNTGKTMIAAYDIANRTWDTSFSASDNAIHGFEVIGGKLVAPGVDATESWDYGNYYVLGDDGKWQKIRNLPNGVHCFDMIQCGDKVFAGLGTETVKNTVAVSEDGGNTFTFAPLYKDGAPYDVSTFQMSRTYEFMQLDGKVYALVYFKTKTGYNRWYIFGYEDGKMHYLADGTKLIERSSFSRKYFGGEFEFNGKCYITTRGLYAIDDFTDPAKWNSISMPNNGKVSDALMWDGAIYVLTSRQDSTTKLYHTVIYKSTTGEKGSFTEVASYDYGGFPMCFDYDGEHFYVGNGLDDVDKSKLGMVLRVKPQ